MIFIYSVLCGKTNKGVKSTFFFPANLSVGFSCRVSSVYHGSPICPTSLDSSSELSSPAREKKRRINKSLCFTESR